MTTTPPRRGRYQDGDELFFIKDNIGNNPSSHTKSTSSRSPLNDDLSPELGVPDLRSPTLLRNYGRGGPQRVGSGRRSPSEKEQEQEQEQEDEDEMGEIEGEMEVERNKTISNFPVDQGRSTTRDTPDIRDTPDTRDILDTGNIRSVPSDDEGRKAKQQQQEDMQRKRRRAEAEEEEDEVDDDDDDGGGDGGGGEEGEDEATKRSKKNSESDGHASSTSSSRASDIPTPPRTQNKKNRSQTKFLLANHMRSERDHTSESKHKGKGKHEGKHEGDDGEGEGEMSLSPPHLVRNTVVGTSTTETANTVTEAADFVDNELRREEEEEEEDVAGEGTVDHFLQKSERNKGKEQEEEGEGVREHQHRYTFRNEHHEYNEYHRPDEENEEGEESEQRLYNNTDDALNGRQSKASSTGTSSAAALNSHVNRYADTSNANPSTNPSTSTRAKASTSTSSSSHYGSDTHRPKEIVKMERGIPHKNLKCFAAAIQCLARIGKEVIVEAQRQGSLILHAMNDAKTAFATITFRPCFFDHCYHGIGPPRDSVQFNSSATGGAHERNQNENDNQNEVLTAKLQLKSCLSVFHSLRTVEKLTLSFVEEGPRHVVMFQAECRQGISKRHQFHYEDTPIVQVSFGSKAEALHVIKARPGMFTEVLNHIHGTDEINLIANPDGVRITSFYHDMDAKDRKGRAALLTDMHVASTDFSTFELFRPPHGPDYLPAPPAQQNDSTDNPDAGNVVDSSEMLTELTFGVRELKAILQFCDASGVSIDDTALYFNTSGSPFLFTSNTNEADDDDFSMNHNGAEAQSGITTGLSSWSSNSFSIDLIMATLPPVEED